MEAEDINTELPGGRRMTYLYLDIETIPAQSDEAKARIASTVKPPATMKKADTIAAWERDQKADAVAEAIAKSSLNAAFGQICCIGLAFDSGDVSSISWPTNADDESTMINGFFQVAGEVIGNRFPVIVGHYITGFDLRFIWQRCMVLGIRVPAWMPRDPKPWDPVVFDTMTAWSGARDTISMDNLCAALGLPGKGDVDGSMIADMWARGEHEAIAAYCRADVERTREIHRKMALAFGEAA
jgi:DNA polymerase elongation subunit (family B)